MARALTQRQQRSSQTVKSAVMRIRALVVDDHPLYCDAMAASLSTVFEMQQVKTVHSLHEALEALSDGLAPDLLMLDLKLPDVTGLSGFLKLKEMQLLTLFVMKILNHFQQKNGTRFHLKNNNKYYYNID